jgi:hypothetical protein
MVSPDRHAQDRAERRAGGLVDGQVQPREADGAEHDPDRPLRLVAEFPGTTSVYAMPISVTARPATGCDGIE